MEKIIDYVNYWNNNKKITTFMSKNNIFYDTHHYVSVSDENNNELTTYKLSETRICFGVLTFPEDNIYIYVHYKYVDNDPSLVIDIYKISEDYIFIKINQLIVKSDFSCGNTTGEVYKIENNCFTVAWSDLFNYDYIKCVTIDEGKIIGEFTISNITEIENYYIISKDIIINAFINGTDNYINIILLQGEKAIFMLPRITLPYNFNSSNEIECKILEFDFNDDKPLCLIRVNLTNNIDALHIESFFIDILLDIKNGQALMISDKINSNVKSTIKEKSIWYDL